MPNVNRKWAKKSFAWSISALTSFETCPKKHANVKIYKKFKEDFGTAADYGKYVHKALERYVKSGTPLPLDIQHLQKYAVPFRNMKKVKGIDVLTEQQLTLNSDYELTGWFDNDAWVRSIADIIITGEKSVLFVDWKTNNQIKDDNFEQLRLLSAMFSIAQPQYEQFHMEYRWLKHKGASTNLSLYKHELSGTWVDLLPRVAIMEQAIKDEVFPARPSGLCKRYCPVTSCPHHGI